MSDVPVLPFEQPNILEVAPRVRALQSQHPVARVRTAVGDEAWLVTRHADVSALLDDQRLGRSHPDPERAARTGNSALFGGAMGNTETEDADHAHMRALLAPRFSARRMRALARQVAGLVDRLLDDMEHASRPVDLHEALAAQLPVLLICQLLGVPAEDQNRFRSWSEGAGDTLDAQRSRQSLAELVGYMRALVARKRADPGDDVLSELTTAHEGRLGDEHIAGLGAGLLFAGHETTMVRLDLGAALLLANLDQRDKLRDDPALIGSAVEEVLRSGGANGTGLPRYARTDMEVDGVEIRAGDAVVLDLAAANHDPRVFPEPDRFDVTRAPNPHLTFGHGSRYCLGASLARIELHAVFGELFQRFRSMRLATPIERLRPRSGTLTGGFAELPVDW